MDDLQQRLGESHSSCLRMTLRTDLGRGDQEIGGFRAGVGDALMKSMPPAWGSACAAKVAMLSVISAHSANGVHKPQEAQQPSPDGDLVLSASAWGPLAMASMGQSGDISLMARVSLLLAAI
jgi:hypothetical protein